MEVILMCIFLESEQMPVFIYSKILRIFIFTLFWLRIFIKKLWIQWIITVLLAFVTRNHLFSVAAPSSFRPRPYGTPLPQRDSQF